MVGAVLERSDRCDFGTVSARGGLEVGRRIAIQITDDPFINVEIVIRLSGTASTQERVTLTAALQWVAV